MDNITSEYDQTIQRAEEYKDENGTQVVSTANLSTLYKTLSNMVTKTILINMEETITVPTNYQKNFDNYYDEKEAVIVAIEQAAKQYTDGTVSAAIEAAKKKIEETAKGDFDKLDAAVGNYLGLGGAATMGSNYVISPYIAGGYLHSPLYFIFSSSPYI